MDFEDGEVYGSRPVQEMVARSRTGQAAPPGSWHSLNGRPRSGRVESPAAGRKDKSTLVLRH